MIGSDKRAWLAVMLVAGIFYAAMVPAILRYLDPVTGDEPFYIMTAISMIRDGDLKESNNYADRDFEEFYPPDPLPADWQGWPAFPRTLPPHPAVTVRDGLYTKHGLGLTMLIALPYEAAGRLGALLLVLACGVALAGQMFLFARESRVERHVAIAAALALAVTLPLAPYTLLIFPEIPAALFVIYAVRRLASGDNTTLQWALSGAAIGFLPWLHQRFALISAVLGIALLLTLWKQRQPGPLAALVPAILGGVSIVAYNLWLYGQPTQNTEDHAGFSGLTGTLNGAAGLVLDAQWGLFVAAPVTIVALAAVPTWTRRAGRMPVLCLAAVTPYVLVVAAYQVWWGEWGPPARYLVPVVPLLAGPLATWLSGASPARWAVAGAAWGWGMLLTIIGFAQPQRFYHHPDGRNNLYRYLADQTGIDFAAPLVPFQFYSAASPTERIAVSLVAATVLTALAVWRFSYGDSVRASREIDPAGNR